MTDTLRIDPIVSDTLPTSFGLFKPVGWMMLGLPTTSDARAVTTRLQRAGWPADSVREFVARETAADLQAMIVKAGPMTGFGYEIALLRRYLALTRNGNVWRLVRVNDDAQASQVAQWAGECGATLAVHYRGLTIDELL